MKLRGELVDGVFVQRLNRFAAMVEVDGRLLPAHLPNSGRMRELLVPGVEALVAARPGPRKTAFDLLMVRHGERWVGVDSRLPSRLLEEALAAGLLELGPFDSIRREVPYGASRLDLLGLGPNGPCLIETKSVNLVQDGVALFPDAPTLRGTRHLEELRRAAESGQQAAVVFVVQRDDAASFRPFDSADPLFAATLRDVAKVIGVLACCCEVSRGEICITRLIPVEL
ncbi:MAG: DNA/RNA nuclease SfsA [Actinobacteria bacterium]|nr:DNA/RNA nuclease SfsA [Actinomycetota bacterium]